MPSKPEPITVEHFCIRCHRRWSGGLAHSYCGDCHRKCQALVARLAQAEQERDALKLSLGRCYELSGADTDGNTGDQLWRHAEYAEAAVEDLRDDFNAAQLELSCRVTEETTKSYAQGRADTLAQVTPLVVDLSELVELWMNGILKDIGVNWIDPPPALQRAKTWLTFPVSPQQEITEKDVTA